MDNLFGWSEVFDYRLYFRGIIITLYAIVLFRANSARLFGNHSPLDFIIYIILGAILGEAIGVLAGNLRNFRTVFSHIFSFYSMQENFVYYYIKINEFITRKNEVPLKMDVLPSHGRNFLQQC